MPIYPFKCIKCNHEWDEFILRSTDEEPEVCPKCQSREIKKMIGQVSHSLKGGGWYKDGYMKKKGH